MQELVVMWFEKMEEEQRAARDTSMRKEELCPERDTGTAEESTSADGGLEYGELTHERQGNAPAEKESWEYSSAITGFESEVKGQISGELKRVVSYSNHAKSQHTEPPAASVADCSPIAILRIADVGHSKKSSTVVKIVLEDSLMIRL